MEPDRKYPVVGQPAAKAHGISQKLETVEYKLEYLEDGAGKFDLTKRVMPCYLYTDSK